MALMIPRPASKPATASTEEVKTTVDTNTKDLAVAFEPEQQEQPNDNANSLAVASSVNNIFNPSQLDYVIESNLSALISKLESSIPDIRTEMITIHKALAKDPAQVTILTQEQQAAIFAGYSKLSGIELVAKAAAKKGSKQPVSLEMFE